MKTCDRIPKIIHYCWFGRGEKPTKVIQTVENWKRILPDYQVIEWNEENFDINFTEYTRQAYEHKKYAFVSDYVRLFALYQMGGIYLDTDVEVIGSFDGFLDEKAFMSFESSCSLCTAVIGAEKESTFIGELMDLYGKMSFVDECGNPDMKPNSERIFETLFSDKQIRDRKISLENATIYPVDYFCAKDYKTYRSLRTDRTVTIHTLDASWYPWKRKVKKAIKKIMVKMKLGFLWKHD